ncbi:hypothetical protein E2562_002811, partial [Oryza meyeriana var. granulata]
VFVRRSQAPPRLGKRFPRRDGPRRRLARVGVRHARREEEEGEQVVGEAETVQAGRAPRAVAFARLWLINRLPGWFFIIKTLARKELNLYFWLRVS